MKRHKPTPEARERLLSQLQPVPINDAELWRRLRQDSEAAGRFAAERGRACERLTEDDLRVRMRRCL